MTTYALVGASEFNSEQFSARNGAGAFDAVIAVDGGFTSLADVGCAPDLAIGDFDSLGYVPEGVEVLVFPPEKDASDMELALGEAVARGAVPWRSTGRSAAGSIIHWRICNFSPLSPSTA